MRTGFICAAILLASPVVLKAAETSPLPPLKLGTELYRAKTEEFFASWCGDEGQGMKTTFFPKEEPLLEKLLKESKARLLMKDEGDIKPDEPTQLSKFSRRNIVRGYSANMERGGKFSFSPQKSVLSWGFRARFNKGGRIQGPFFVADGDLGANLLPEHPAKAICRGGEFELSRMVGLILKGRFAIPVGGAVLYGTTEEGGKTLLLMVFRCLGELPETKENAEPVPVYTLAGWMLRMSKSELTSIFRKEGPRPTLSPQGAQGLRAGKRYGFAFAASADPKGFSVSAQIQCSYIKQYEEEQFGSRKIYMPLTGVLNEGMTWEEGEREGAGQNAVTLKATLRLLRRPFVYRKEKKSKEKVLWPVIYEMGVKEALVLPDGKAAAEHERGWAQQNVLLPLLDQKRKHRGALLRTVKVWVFGGE